MDLHSADVHPTAAITQIARWGNSLAVRLPASVVEALTLCEGDHIEFVVDGARRVTLRRKPDQQELLTRLRSFRGRLPADLKFSRDESNARGAAISPAPR